MNNSKILIGLGISAGLIALLSSFSRKKFVSNMNKNTPDSKKPTGITFAVFNMNPLNIKAVKDRQGILIKNRFYAGEITVHGAIHKMFENWAYGTAAGIVHLWRYMNGQVTGNAYPAGTKLNTIEKIVKTWAPVTDGNDTEGYINYVVRNTGMKRDKTIPFERDIILKLVSVMAFREDGKAAAFLNRDVLSEGWSIANDYIKTKLS